MNWYAVKPGPERQRLKAADDALQARWQRIGHQQPGHLQRYHDGAIDYWSGRSVRSFDGNDPIAEQVARCMARLDGSVQLVGTVIESDGFLYLDNEALGPNGDLNEAVVSRVISRHFFRSRSRPITSP